MSLLDVLGLQKKPASPPLAARPEVEDRQAQAPPTRAERREKANAARLRDMAVWPQRAHRAWKRLPMNEQVAVAVQMASLYGNDFAKAFSKFTRSGARLDNSDYVTALPHQTPQWFGTHGYKLAQKASYQQWWVHPSGHIVYLVFEHGGTKKGPQQPPPPPPPLEDCAELLKITLESLDADLEEDNERQAELIREKEAMDKLNVTSDEFETAYKAYVEGLKEATRRVNEQIQSAEDALASLQETKCGTGNVRDKLAELEELRIWFQVTADLLQMEGRVPIRVKMK